MIEREKFFWLSTLFLFALLISQPAFSTDAITFGHDFLFHTYRIEGMAESLSGGQFPVRVVGKSFAGYGELSGVFYPDLFFYIPALLRLAGVPLFVAYNFFCVLINVATIFLTYWAFNRLLRSTKAAAICSMIYGGFLYRLIDLYVRSALGEAIAMAFLPLALISLWLMLNRSGKYWAAATIGFTGVLQSHILSSLLLIAASIVIALLSFKQLKRKEILLSTAKATGVTALLNVWFYVPFLDFYNGIDFHMKAMIRPSNILSTASFELGFFADMQLFIGWSIVLILTALIIRLRAQLPAPWLLIFSFGLLTVTASTKIFPWSMFEALPVIGQQLGVLQFPFRFITFGSIAFAYCVGTALAFLIDNIKHSKLIAIICCVVIAQCNFIFLNDGDGKPSTISGLNWYIDRDDALYRQCFVEHAELGYIDYIYGDITYADVFEGYAVEEMFDNLSKPKKLRADDIAPRDVVSDYRKTGMTIEFTARTEEPTVIRLPLFYYPGYEAKTSDGRSLTVGSIDKHRLTVEVPSGETRVRIEYVDKISWRLALIGSLIGLIVLIVGMRREGLC